MDLNKLNGKLRHTSNEAKPTPPTEDILAGLNGVAASPCRKKRYLRVRFIINNQQGS